MNRPSVFLRTNLLLTDIGFIAYWLITACGILPTAWLFKDYHNPVLVAWNWSFAPLDLSASMLGLLALALAKSRNANWRWLASISITLTFCAGLMALSFWTLRADFDFLWWLPNLYLMIWPLYGLSQLLKGREQ